MNQTVQDVFKLVPVLSNCRRVWRAGRFDSCKLVMVFQHRTAQIFKHAREERLPMKAVEGCCKDAINRKKLIHLRLLRHCKQMKDVRVCLEVLILPLFATRDALFHYVSELREHRVNIALADAVKHSSELFLSFKHASLRVNLSQALFELRLPDR